MADSGQLSGAIREALEVFGTDVEAANRILQDHYSDDMVFKDPIQTLHGLDAFLAMNRRLAARSKTANFEVKRVVETEEDIFLVWTMVFQPKGGPVLTFEGSSHLELRDGRIARHTDYWDLLGGLMESVPGVGALYRAVLKRLG